MSDLNPEIRQVQLKVRCSFVGHVESWTKGKLMGSVKLSCVATGENESTENKAFFAATPSGSMEFQTVNEDAMSMFSPGREYIVSITPAKDEV